MTSVRTPVSRKRSAPKEVEEDGPTKRSRTSFSASAAGLVFELTKNLLRGAHFIKDRMADWLLTPRTDFRSLYNIKPRRPLPQGQLTQRSDNGFPNGRNGQKRENFYYEEADGSFSNRRTAETDSFSANKVKIVSRTSHVVPHTPAVTLGLSKSHLNNSRPSTLSSDVLLAKYTGSSSFRFGNGNSEMVNKNGLQARRTGPSDDKVRQPLFPSEKYRKRRPGENFREYTSMGPRLFAKSPRRMKYYGGTVDRVRNLEERNNYARLLATLASQNETSVSTSNGTKYSNPRTAHATKRDDDVMITCVEKAPDKSPFDYSSTWEKVDDSLVYVKTYRDNGQRSHHLRPWQRSNNQKSSTTNLPAISRDYSTLQSPNQRSADSEKRSMNQSLVLRSSTSESKTGKVPNQSRSDSRSSTNDDVSSGIAEFVNRIRIGLESRKSVQDLFPENKKYVAKKVTSNDSLIFSPRTTTSRIRDVMRQATSGNEDDDDLVLLEEGSDKNDVEVELEILPTKLCGVIDRELLRTRSRMDKKRAQSPDVVAIEPVPLTSSRSRDGLEQRLKSIPYVDKAWIKLQRQESEERAKAFLRSRVEAEMEIKIFKESRMKESERLEEVIKKQLRIAELVPAVVAEPEEEEEEAEVYPELTGEMENTVDAALGGGSPSEVLVDHMRIQIRRSDLQTLEGSAWLNDEVINFHMNLMIQRGEEEGRPKVHAFNTFFYQKLVQQGHSALKRWTKKVDIFSKDYVVVPVHLQMHWCVAIVDFRKKEIRYYDSMGGSNNQCLNAIKKYLEDESMDKKKKKYNTSVWQLINAKGPQQMNGSDCGVFSTICAEHITRDAPLTYTQDLMPYFRRRMVYEIMSKRLMQ